MVNKKTVWGVSSIALRLLVICLAVAALTALVYGVTKDPIAKGERARKESAIRGIFAEVGSFSETDMTGDGFNTVYKVFDGKPQFIGWCVDYTGNSDYGGAVNMMIGVDANGKVSGLQVISHGETFMDRYLDENGRYTGVELSSGATMSYNAIQNAIAAIEAHFAPVAAANKTNDTRPAEFTLEDAKLLFAGAADISQRETVSASGVNAVCVVKGGDGTVLGRCVQYSATDTFSGDLELLMEVSSAGKVGGVLVLRSLDTLLDCYFDNNGLYTGAELSAGATMTHNALRNAINAVESLGLGGAV